MSDSDSVYLALYGNIDSRCFSTPKIENVRPPKTKKKKVFPEVWTIFVRTIWGRDLFGIFGPLTSLMSLHRFVGQMSRSYRRRRRRRCKRNAHFVSISLTLVSAVAKIMSTSSAVASAASDLFHFRFVASLLAWCHCLMGAVGDGTVDFSRISFQLRCNVLAVPKIF